MAQRGNILFLILLAVVLFAALSYAVTSSMRGGGPDASSESAVTAASEIINYAVLLETTVQRLRLVNNCALKEISFENSIVSGFESNYPRADKSCNLFDAAGGGVSWKTPDSSWFVDSATVSGYTGPGGQYKEFTFPVTVCVHGAGTGICDNTAATKDLVVGLKYLTQSVCDAINKKLGYATISVNNAALAGNGDFYKGDFFGSGQYAASALSNRMTACSYNNQTGYTFYHVLEPQ